MSAIITEITTELGTVINAITAANGYNNTVETVVYDMFDSISNYLSNDDLFPVVNIDVNGFDVEDIDNETSELSVHCKIVGYLRPSEQITDTAAFLNDCLEFGADIRKAVFSMYSRQQAGSFAMEEFRTIKEMRVSAYQDKGNSVQGVMCEFDVLFDLDFDTI